MVDGGRGIGKEGRRDCAKGRKAGEKEREADAQIYHINV